MAAYIIFIQEKLKDAAARDVYRKMVPATFEGHTMTRRAGGGRIEALEGPKPENCVILEFPTLEAAKAWYSSPGYQEATKQRLKAGEYRVMIVEGVD
ncbi:MAG: DUF1330 domain-containing protein [Hyphomonadaceae bacterium]